MKNLFNFVLLFTLIASSQAYIFIDNFDAEHLDDWQERCATGTWQIDSGYVTGSTSTTPAALVPVNEAFYLTDCAISTKVTGQHAFGVIARLDDNDSGVIAYLSPDANVARIRLVGNSQLGESLASIGASFPSGVVYNLEFICSGDQLQFNIESVSTSQSWSFSAIDPNPQAGKFGLLMGNESGASWDWIAVDQAPTETENPMQLSISTQAHLSASQNPFSGSLIFSYLATDAESSSLDIFDLSGRLVQTINVIPDGSQQSINWDGRNSSGSYITPGVYFAKLRGLDETTIRLIKI